MEPVIKLLSDLPLPAMMKVVHSVLDSLNRRRAPSRDILLSVDGPEDSERVADVASRVVERIENAEGRTLVEMPAASIRRYAEELLAAVTDKSQHDLPAADESRARAMLDDLRTTPPVSR